MKPKQSANLLRRFFAGLAEQTFQVQLGVADPPLIDYLSDLLARFLRNDTVHRVRSVRGRPLTEIGQMLLEANQRIGPAKREVHRHIGDFSLFWAGLYPESLRKRHGDDWDRFGDYVTHGRRAYLIASSIDQGQEETAPADVLERLGHDFELCAYGLREVRREWERRDEEGEIPPPLLLG